MKDCLKKLTRPVAITLCLIIAVAFVPLLSEDYAAHAASGKVKMTTYNEVIKINNTVYCAGAKGIYKVKLKNGRIKSKKLLTRASTPMSGGYTYIYYMKKKGGYIYYIHATEGTFWTLFRVNEKTGKRQKIADFGEQHYFGYVIKGKKIYYDEPLYDEDYNVKTNVLSINLNGSSPKKSSVKPNMKSKSSNKKGYSVVIKDTGKYSKDYLKTPAGKFYLGKVKVEDSY